MSPVVLDHNSSCHGGGGGGVQGCPLVGEPKCSLGDWSREGSEHSDMEWENISLTGLKLAITFLLCLPVEFFSRTWPQTERWSCNSKVCRALDSLGSLWFQIKSQINGLKNTVNDKDLIVGTKWFVFCFGGVFCTQTWPLGWNHTNQQGIIH